MLVSFAIGTLLGAAFLEIIPHAFATGRPHQAASAILGGIFAFFVLEKLLLWRHCHTEDCEVHDHARHARPRRSGLADRGRRHGPQLRRRRADRRRVPAEHRARRRHRDRHHRARDPAGGRRLPDPAALGLHARRRALAAQHAVLVRHRGRAACSATSRLQVFAGLEPTLLGIVAASMIYVAVADLIPGLHRRPRAARHRLAGAPHRPRHRHHRGGREWSCSTK